MSHYTRLYASQISQKRTAIAPRYVVAPELMYTSYRAPVTQVLAVPFTYGDARYPEIGRWGQFFLMVFRGVCILPGMISGFPVSPADDPVVQDA